MFEVLCVAFAVYFESRGEPIAGQKAVASVIWNRRNDSRWPNNACEVISQKGQFESWPLIGKELRRRTININKYLAIASATADEPTTEALFFAAPNLLPYKYVTKIGNHVFYVPLEDK